MQGKIISALVCVIMYQPIFSMNEDFIFSPLDEELVSSVSNHSTTRPLPIEKFKEKYRYQFNGYSSSSSSCSGSDRQAVSDSFKPLDNQEVIRIITMFESNYNGLAEFFYEQCDRVDNEYLIDTNQLTLDAWIEEKAFGTGNIVCAYFFVRNYLKKTNYSTVDKKTLARCLTMMLLCLKLVAYDIVQHYTYFKKKSVFSVYSTFKQKIYNLLKYCVSNPSDDCFVGLSDNELNWSYLDKEKNGRFNFSTVLNQATEHWKNNEWNTLRRSYAWVGVFGWAHGWTPNRWGISFGIEQVSDNKRYEPIQSKYITMIENIFVKISSWEEFFQSFDFPFTHELLCENFIDEFVLL